MNALIMKKLLLTAADLILENISYLTELDSTTGDGDHGVTMEKIANKIREDLNGVSGSEKLETLLDDLSWELMNINGGSAGPLWGAFFEGMAAGAAKEVSSEDEKIKNILLEGYENFSSVSGAKPGEKTMMDAIYPATMIVKNQETSFKEIAAEMAKAAVDGAEDTVNMVAKFGRAKSLNEKSLGHKDPGAVSFSLFYKGLADGINSIN